MSGITDASAGSKLNKSLVALDDQNDPNNFFPHLPTYADPKTGFLSLLPSSWIPYAQLMRLDRPAGLYAFYVPYLIGTVYAACIADPTPSPRAVLGFTALLLPLNIILRGVACAWNDNVDQGFDRKVKRCRHRPIARGAVSTAQGHLFTITLAVAGCPFLVFLPSLCSIHMAAMVAMFLLYALAKRVTYYPQVILGIPFAWAICFCIAAFGMDPFGDNLRSTSALIAANILWTIIYDTVYAHQDIEDDERAGVKGMAVRFRHSTKILAIVLAAAQVLFLAWAGQQAGFSLIYYIGTVGGVALTMAYYIWVVDLAKPDSCGSWFHTQFWTVGAGFLSGLMGEYALRLIRPAPSSPLMTQYWSCLASFSDMAGFDVFGILVALQSLTTAFLVFRWTILPPHLRTWPLSRKIHMPPGPTGWPVVGSLLPWLRARKDIRSLNTWLLKQAEYGDMTTLHMGTKTWVLLNTRRAVDEIFVKRAALTHERPYMPIAGGLVSKDQRIFLSKSESWREGRHLVHQVMTGPGSKDHDKLTEEESTRLLQSCLDSPRKWYEHNYRYCIAIMHKIVTGETLCATSEELKDLLSTTTAFVASINASFVDFFPQLARVPKALQIWRSPWDAIGTLHYEIIQRWWNSLEHVRRSDAAPSFIRDVVIPNFVGSEDRKDKGKYLAMSLLTAGGDNPRRAMTAWYMSCLSAPETVAKSRAELDSVCKSSTPRLPILNDLENCPYTCALVKEVLRWRPVVPLSPQRVLVRPLHFEGYSFPAGTEFLANGVSVCRSGFETPDDFRPERWLGQGGREANPVAQDRWTFAFSGGRRMCVGYKLAQKELFVALARLI